MMDYRGRPHESPLLWCVKCQGLKPVTPLSKVMKTVFHIESTGIYPFGECEQHVSQIGRQPEQEPKE